MKTIQLTNGMVAMVDAEDAERLSAFTWKGSFRKKWYARAGGGEDMHRMVMGATAGQIVDHINGDGLDNRKCNLRFCTTVQNCANRGRTFRKNGRNDSRYKGVIFTQNRWRMDISANKKQIRKYKFCDTEIEAALAYDEAAKELYGEFAYLNFPNGAPSIPALGDR